MQNRTSFFIFLFIVLGCQYTVIAQPAWTIDIFGKEKKPEKYEEKKLASEKTGEKSFKGIRKFMQNNTSHYNFYYNANNKLNAVIERAKLSSKDDYSKLLQFYPYTLENTAIQKTDLDSVIYKATAGILLHDLRTEWVDNFYLLIGKAYYLKKDLDSAALTFQFINYNLFPRTKKDDDYNKIVGSNSNDAGSGVGSVTIADKEKRNILQKAFTQPASRNDALIWQIRTFTEQKEYGDAAGLISILQNDKNLPKRLQNDLEEATAYWFYAQNNLDSSANHLAKALSNADSKQDKSRWEYLLAQMYEVTGNYDNASAYYAKVSKHTNDPVMDIYARLNDAKMLRKNGDNKELANSIANLLKMAKKDKYDTYRDIIYYSAAQLSLQQPDTTNSISYYFKSIENNPTATSYKDLSFIQLGDIAFTQKRYTDAKSFYDSVTTTSTEIGFDLTSTDERKEILSRLVPPLNTIELQDSLQLLATLTSTDREAIVKKIIKKYRKENGLKADDAFEGNTLITFNERNTEPVDLFRSAAANTGEWYFYSTNLRSKGFNDFKVKWGKRTNVDNWRRNATTSSTSAIVKNANSGLGSTSPDTPASKDLTGTTAVANATTEITYEGLMSQIPTTPEMIDSSNILTAKSMLTAAEIFQNELQDYNQAIELYEKFLQRFSKNENVPNVYRALNFCYTKIGNVNKANQYKNSLLTNYPGSDAAKKINMPIVSAAAKNPAATVTYENIYNQFIEGKFDEAIAQKKVADSLYGINYWSPQLLYIEAMYHIKQRNDSNAIAQLRNLVTLYPTSALKPKAATMIDVLSRRAEIEKYLTELEITRTDDDKVIVANDNPNTTTIIAPSAPTAVKIIAAPTTIKPRVDTIKTPDAFISKNFVLQPEAPFYVAMILDKVDGVYVTEAKNAFTRFNKSSMATINITINKDAIDADKALLLFANFENATEAIKYYDKIKKAAPSEISWLQASKYSFTIISDSNLQILKANKDLQTYRQLLNSNFGNKF